MARSLKARQLFFCGDVLFGRFSRKEIGESLRIGPILMFCFVIVYKLHFICSVLETINSFATIVLVTKELGGSASLVFVGGSSLPLRPYVVSLLINISLFI